MNITRLVQTVILLVFVSFYKVSAQEVILNSDEFPVLSGKYLGQEAPGETAEVFAPGIISNGLSNRDVAISPDGNEMFFGIHTPDFSYATIIVTQQINGVWTKPEVASFASNPNYIFLEPALSFDGSKLFFLSNMPKDSTEKPADEDIWVVEKVDGKWGDPYNLGTPVNSDAREFYPSITKNGTLYFTRAEIGERVHYIYRSLLVDGAYTEPEKLPEQVNCGTNRFNAYVAPDESFIVIPAIGIESGLGGVDYYIVFRNEDGTWQDPINMGPKINSATGAEWSFYMSPDKKYCFYMATKKLPAESQPEKLSMEFFHKTLTIPQNGNPDIYWIDAKIIDNLKQGIVE